MMLEKPPPGQLVGLLGLPPAAPPDESPEEGPGEPFPPPSMEPEAPAPPGRQWQQTVTIRISHLLVVAVALAFVGGFGFHAALFPSPGLPSGGSSSLAPAATAPPAGNGRISVSEDNDPSVGPSSAKVVLIEFSDFQCPFCLRAQPTVEQLLSTYGDRIRFVYRHYPLPNHPNARPAAEASVCAGEQGKFWPYHDKLFANPSKLADADLKKGAADLGLDASRFNACVDSHKYKSEVDADIRAGEEAGVNGTPAFFVNGRMISGAQPFEVFKRVIEEELELKKR